MAGIHGKNAQIRVSSSETVISGVEMVGTQGSFFQIPAGQRDWKYDRDTILIQFTTDKGGPALNVTNASGVQIGVQTRLINYAGGAIHLGQYPTVASGVYAMARSMQLATIGNLVGDARSFSVNVSADSVDSTVIGDTWRSFEDGISAFEGTLDGLWISPFWYKKAISTLSGLFPRTVLRLNTDPKSITTYFQGTVIFPSTETSGGHDALIEYSVPFQGRGPLDLVENNVPFFKVHETT